MKSEEIIYRLLIGGMLILLMLSIDPVMSLLSGIGLYIMGTLS